MNAIKFTVNGKAVTVKAHPMARLLDVLRESLHLTGTKEGCGEGECGACSVMLNNRLVNSCLVPVAELAGKKITTIEGIKNPKLKNAFLNCGGAQCGICTPGMMVAAHCLLQKKQKLKAQGIAYALAGNICRCTGFEAIIESVKEASR